MSLPELASHQLLELADRFCERYQLQVKDLTALVACAAVPTARIDGVALYSDPHAAARALARIIQATAPLSAANAEFGAFAAEVYARYAADYEQR